MQKKEQKPEEIHYSFILFVISDGEHSRQARENLIQLCEKYLAEPYEIKIVDVAEDFQTALDYNILVTPSVVVTDPKPQTVIHGDLSDPDKFIDALNLSETEVHD